MSKLAAARKAIVAVVGVAVAFGLLDEGTAQTVVAVATPILVYLIPNTAD